MRRLLTAATVILILAAARPALADVEVEVKFGFQGHIVAGTITPLVVRVESKEKAPVRVRIEARSGARMGSGELCHATDSLSPGAMKEFTFLIRPYQSGSPSIRIDFDRRVTVVQSAVPTPRPVSSFEASVEIQRGEGAQMSPAAYQLLAVGHGAADLPEREATIRVMPIDEDDLFTVWHAYEGVDAVLWRTPGAKAPIDPQAVEALLRWVRLGGRLIIVPGSRPDLLRGTILETALPAEIGPPVANVDYIRVAVALNGSRPDPRDGPPGVQAAILPLTPTPDGRPLARLEGGPPLVVEGAPLIVERKYGRGKIVVTAFDTQKFGRTKGKTARSMLFPVLVGERSKENLDKAMVDAFGNADLLWGTFSVQDDGDPLSAVSRLLRVGAIKAPPMGLLSLFMILYILAVGPLDYFVLKKRNLLKWSALSFLGLAILFSVSAWFVSFYLFAGGTRVNRVTFVDVVPGATEDSPDLVLVNDLAGFYAPRGDTVGLEADADVVHYSDFALSPSYVGMSGGGLPKDPVVLDMTSLTRPTARVSVPFRSLRSTRTVLLRESVLPLEVSLAEGRLTVRNHLPFTLRDPVLVGPRGIMRLQDIESGGERVDFPWTPNIPIDDAFRTGLNDQQLMPSASLMNPPDEDVLYPEDRQRFARALQAWSVGGAFRKIARDENLGPTRRLFEKSALDRSRTVREGGHVFLAWTADRDPVGLPGADEDGFTITVIRKVLRP